MTNFNAINDLAQDIWLHIPKRIDVVCFAMRAKRLISTPRFRIFDQTSITEKNWTFWALFRIYRHLEADQAPHNVRQTLIIVLISNFCSRTTNWRLFCCFLLWFFRKAKLSFSFCFCFLLICARSSCLLLLCARRLNRLVNRNYIRLDSKFF